MKTRWDVRAKSHADESYRVFYCNVPFFHAVRAVIRYMKQYDEVTVRRSKMYGGRR